MPIILAIEPDRRQAAHLTGIVRKRVGAELILADTTEGALDAIGNRVPDMVLVPAFLSPQDDASLAAALRVIAAAAHVRTLTIPVLSSGEKRAAPGGILARWRRARTESPAPEGCDPAVFAEQITAYLKEAAAERAELEMGETVEIAPMVDLRPLEFATLVVDTVEPVATLIVDAPPLEPAMPVVDTVEPVATLIMDAPPLEPAMPVVDTVEPVATLIVDAPPVEPATPVVDAVEPVATLIVDAPPLEPATPVVDTVEPVATLIVDAPPLEPATPVVDAVEPVALPLAAMPEPADDDEGAIDLSAELTFLSEGGDDAHEAADGQRFAGEPVGVDTIEIVAVEPASIVEEAVVETTGAGAAGRPRADLAPWTEMYVTPGRMWPTLEGVQAEAPPPDDECPSEPEPVAARPRPLEWTELVASLRQDIERRRAERVPAADPPMAARAANVATIRGSQSDAERKRRSKNLKPAQDEWGFFDPEQCGFAALLAKLDQVTVGPDATDDDVGRPA